jgi:predicted Zn-dependent protease
VLRGIRWNYGMAALAEGIAAVVGWPAVEELTAKLLEIARAAQARVASRDVPPEIRLDSGARGDPRDYALVLAAAGTMVEPVRQMLHHIASAETDAEWRADLRAVADGSELARVRDRLAIRDVRAESGQAAAGAEAEARDAIARGEYVEAVPHLERLVAEHPGDARHHWRLGYALHRAGRAEEGVAALREAVRLRPGWELPYAYVGQVLLARRRDAEALRHLVTHKPAAVEGRSAFYLYVVGKAWMRRREWGRALNALSRCVALRGYPRDALRCGMVAAQQLIGSPESNVSAETRKRTRLWIRQCERRAVMLGLWPPYVWCE